MIGAFHAAQAQGNTWTAIDSMNGPPKSVTTSFVLNNEGYVVGGLTDTEFTRKMYSYNPNQNDWDNELSWGGETGSGQNRGSAVSFVINNKAYVGLGEGNSAAYYKDLWEYDPVNQTWTQVADFAGSARHGAVSFATPTHGYVGTGQSETGLMKDFYKYDPTTNSWMQINDFSGSARKYAVGFMMGAQGYVATGDDGVLKNDLWQYHPEFDLWVQKAVMPTIGRSGAVGWGTFPSLFIGMGEDATGNFKKDLWEYNFYANDWVQRTDLPGPPRKFATAFCINEVAYVGSGYNAGVFLDDFYSYVRQLGMTEIAPAPLQIFPNPTNDFIQLPVNLNLKKLQLIDERGQFINIQRSNSTLDVSTLAKGSYELLVETETGQLFQTRFMKQ